MTQDVVYCQPSRPGCQPDERRPAATALARRVARDGPMTAEELASESGRSVQAVLVTLYRSADWFRRGGDGRWRLLPACPLARSG